MKIAVEGCMHGDLDKVYATLLHIEKLQNTKIDLLLCCGDFQAVRNQSDLNCMAVPEKYLSMKSFWKYYSGQEVAPIPTIFIGGNHEASNYLWELYYGGWAAPNIYFLGFAGVIKFGNLRIGGLSGIYDHRTYCLGHYERPPYPGYSRRTVYHVREYDVHKLLQVEEKIDIFLSHDWPRGITNCGNVQQLLRKKPYFKAEISKGILGSRAAAQLLDKLKPSYWFSAHLHCKFPAVVQHGAGGPITKFLALDKCLPHRNFLQVLEVDSAPGPYEIHYDEEWLSITKNYNPFFPLTRKFMEINDGSLDDCREWVSEKLKNGRKKLFDFVPTAPFHDPSNPLSRDDPVGIYRNRQTELLLEFLELPYLLDRSPNQVNAGSAERNSEYIDIDNIEDDEDEDENGETEVNAGPAEHNSECIDIDNIEDADDEDNIEDADDEDNIEDAADEDDKGETGGVQSDLDK